MKSHYYLSHAKAQRRKGKDQCKYYLGALASLRENKQNIFRSDWTLSASGGARKKRPVQPNHSSGSGSY